MRAVLIVCVAVLLSYNWINCLSLLTWRVSLPSCVSCVQPKNDVISDVGPVNMVKLSRGMRAS